MDFSRGPEDELPEPYKAWWYAFQKEREERERRERRKRNKDFNWFEDFNGFEDFFSEERFPHNHLKMIQILWQGIGDGFVYFIAVEFEF